MARPKKEKVIADFDITMPLKKETYDLIYAGEIISQVRERNGFWENRTEKACFNKYGCRIVGLKENILFNKTTQKREDSPIFMIKFTKLIGHKIHSFKAKCKINIEQTRVPEENRTWWNEWESNYKFDIIEIDKSQQ